MERQIYLANLNLDEVKEKPSIITETIEKGHVPQIHTIHADANTVSCLVGEHLASTGRKFHEIYASPQDTPENFAVKARSLKDDETAILVRHTNEYSEPTMDAVWDFMYKYKERLVVIYLERKK